MLLLILFTIVLQQVRGYSPINHAWTNHFVALLFFYLRILSISAHRNTLFSTEYRHTMAFFDLSECTNPACHLSLLPCVLFSIFFCSRYSALFSMERLLPEWMPQALWVLKEVSLLRQCVDSPHLSLRLTFGAFISPFSEISLWHVSVGAFPLWARRRNAWYSCQCLWCTPCNRRSWDSITLSASWGNIFAAPHIRTRYAAVSNLKDLPAYSAWS